MYIACLNVREKQYSPSNRDTMPCTRFVQIQSTIYFVYPQGTSISIIRPAYNNTETIWTHLSTLIFQMQIWAAKSIDNLSIYWQANCPFWTTDSNSSIQILFNNFELSGHGKIIYVHACFRYSVFDNSVFKLIILSSVIILTDINAKQPVVCDRQWQKLKYTLFKK